MQFRIWDIFSPDRPLTLAVFLLLLGASVLSWTVAFSKFGLFRKVRSSNLRFLRSFRKATSLDALGTAIEQFRGTPLATVFEYGWTEIERQVRARQTLYNKAAIERSLELAIGEEIAVLERNLNWLATVATVTPFVGLFGTVWGIIDAFQALSTAGAASLRVVGPGIADALVATAFGLGAAIPAAVVYNWCGQQVKEIGGVMEDFTLEFLNAAERTYED